VKLLLEPEAFRHWHCGTSRYCAALVRGLRERGVEVSLPLVASGTPYLASLRARPCRGAGEPASVGQSPLQPIPEPHIILELENLVVSVGDYPLPHRRVRQRTSDLSAAHTPTVVPQRGGLRVECELPLGELELVDSFHECEVELESLHLLGHEAPPAEVAPEIQNPDRKTLFSSLGKPDGSFGLHDNTATCRSPTT